MRFRFLNPSRWLTGAALALAVGVGTTLAAPAALAAPSALVASVASCDQNDASSPFAQYRCAKGGDLLDVRIGDVHPTQPSLGFDEVYYKLGRYTLGKDGINKRFQDWCEANGLVKATKVSSHARLDDPTSFTCARSVGEEDPASLADMKTAIIGPGGQPYLTDGHHTLTTFYEAPDGGADLHLRLRVVANLSDLTAEDFWKVMRTNKWTYLRTTDGGSITPDRLPTQLGLGNFADDRFRSLLYFERGIGFEPSGVPFGEFYWGDWIRDAKPIDLSSWDRGDLDSYLATAKALAKAMTGLPKDGVVDNGFTAADLGVLDEWNNGESSSKGEFGKLSRPYTKSDPGKLAYLLEYRRTHGLA